MPALSAVEEKGQTFMSTMMPSTHFRVSERTIESSISSLPPSALLLLSAAMLAYGSYTPSGTSSPLGLLLLLFDVNARSKSIGHGGLIGSSSFGTAAGCRPATTSDSPTYSQTSAQLAMCCSSAAKSCGSLAPSAQLGRAMIR